MVIRQWMTICVLMARCASNDDCEIEGVQAACMSDAPVNRHHSKDWPTNMYGVELMLIIGEIS